jgi:hypothetical protein
LLSSEDPEEVCTLVIVIKLLKQLKFMPIAKPEFNANAENESGRNLGTRKLLNFARKNGFSLDHQFPNG